MTLRVIRFGLALLFSAAGAGLCRADCAALYALAQQHAYDMARRNSLDHAGFMRHRGAGRRRRRECRGRMRDRGMCEAHVDAIAAAPRQHDARRVPGRCLCCICQWSPLLGDGDRRWRWRWWRQRQRGRPRLFHRRQQRAVARTAAEPRFRAFGTRGHSAGVNQCPLRRERPGAAPGLFTFSTAHGPYGGYRLAIRLAHRGRQHPGGAA